MPQLLPLHRLAVADARPGPPEAEILVNPERTRRILRVDAQGCIRHARVRDGTHGLGDQRRCEAATTPWSPDADVVEPSALLVRLQTLGFGAVMVAVDEVLMFTARKPSSQERDQAA